MRLATLLQLLVSAALLAVLASWIDLGAARDAFAAADPPLLLLAVVVATGSRVLMGVKWNVLLRAKGLQIPWAAAVRLYYVSGFAGLFLPSTVGGDAVRGVLTIRERGHSAIVVSSIVVERVIGLLALLLFGAFGGLLLYELFEASQRDAQRLVAIALGLLVAVSAAVWFGLTETCGRIVAGLLERLAKRKKGARLAALVSQLYESLRSYRTSPRALAAFFALTVVENLLPVCRAWIVGLAMGADVSLLYYFVVVPVALFAVRLPISIEGFGLREGVFVFFLSLAGVEGAVAFGIGLMQYLVTVVAILPGAVLYFAARRAAGPAPAPPVFPSSARLPKS